MADEYKYRQTYFGSKKVEPAIVAQELAKLRNTGGLTAERTVEAAKPAKAPLHDSFQWDDKLAGGEYRLIQARRLIRSIVVVSEPAEGQEPEAPRSLYVHVEPEKSGEGTYILLADAHENIDEFERALAEARRYLDSAEQRFQELRRLGKEKGGGTEILAIAAQGFSTVRQALELLRVA